MTAKTENAIKEAVAIWYAQNVPARIDDLCRKANNDLYFGPSYYSTETGDECSMFDDCPKAAFNFCAACDEMRGWFRNCGNKPKFYDANTGEFLTREPEGFMDEETGEYVEPFYDEIWDIRDDFAAMIFGRELAKEI